MIPRLRRYGTVCLVIAFMLSGPAVAFSSSPDSVGVADEKMEAAAEKAFEEINKKMSEAQEAYYKPLTEAREKGLSDKEMEKIELDPELDPVMVVGPEMLKTIDKYAGTDAALGACDQMLALAGRSESAGWMAEKVMSALKAHYLKNEKLVDVLRYSHYCSEAMAPAMCDFLSVVVSESPHREVQAAGCYSLAKIKGKKEETRSEGLALLKKVQDEYGDVSYGRSVYADKVKGDLFEMKNLQVGCVAPEIIGKEISGKLMQLSSFRGKVILLDFWGDW